MAMRLRITDQSYDCRCTILARNWNVNSIQKGKEAHGFGVGIWMGFGGKVEPRETIHERAARESEEETGIAIQNIQVQKIGLLLFTFYYIPDYLFEASCCCAMRLAGALHNNMKLGMDRGPIIQNTENSKTADGAVVRVVWRSLSL